MVHTLFLTDSQNLNPTKYTTYMVVIYEHCLHISSQRPFHRSLKILNFLPLLLVTKLMLCALQLHLLYSANFVVILATLPRFVTVKESRGRAIIKVYEPSIFKLIKLIVLHTPLTLSSLTMMHTLCFISKSSTITIFLPLNGFSATMGIKLWYGRINTSLYIRRFKYKEGLQ